MHEQSPDQVVKGLERQLWLRRTLPLIIFDVVMSAITSDPSVAKAAYEKAHEADALLHD